MALLAVFAGAAVAQDATVTFSSDSYSVNEGNAVTPELVLSRSRSEASTVLVEPLGLGQARSGEDYAAGPWRVTIPAGQTRQTFSIATIDDGNEDNEQFLLHIPPYGHSSGVSRGSRSGDNAPDAVVTIRGPDQVTIGQMNIVETAIRVNEERDRHTVVTVRRTNKTHLPTSVTVTATDGTATAGEDFEAGPWTVTIPGHQLTARVRIPILDDDTNEGAEDFTVSLSDPSHGTALGSRTSVTVTIEADPRVGFASESRQTVREGTTAHIGLVLSTPRSVHTEVQVHDFDGTATSGVDYPAGPYTVTFGPWQTETVLTIPITQDSEVEMTDENTLLRLFVPDSPEISVMYPESLVVLIADDDVIHGPPTLSKRTIHEGQTRTFVIRNVPHAWTGRPRAEIRSDDPVNRLSAAFCQEGTTDDNNAQGIDVCINSTMTGVVWDSDARILFVQMKAARDRRAEGSETFTLKITDSMDSSKTASFDFTVTDRPTDWQTSVPGMRCFEPARELEDVFPGRSRESLTDAEFEEFVQMRTPEYASPPSGVVVDWDRASYQSGSGTGAKIRFRTKERACGVVTIDYEVRSQGQSLPLGPSSGAWVRHSARILRGETQVEASFDLTTGSAGTVSFRIVGVSIQGGEEMPTPEDGDGNPLTPGSHSPVAASVVMMAPPPLPEVKIGGASSGEEGNPVSFQLVANPPPAESVEVIVTVTAEGDFGVETGTHTVTIPTSGSAFLDLPTENDDMDEPHGSVMLTIEPRAGYYTLGLPAAETAEIVDDDEPVDGLTDGNVQDQNDNTLPAAHPVMRYASLVKSFHDRITARNQHGNGPAGGWNKRFLKAMGHPEYVGYPQAAVTVADATRLWNHGGPGANTAWDGTVEAVTYAEQYFAGQVTPPAPTPDPVPVPAVTIAAGSDVTEGGSASFVLTATPAPASALDVTVTIAASGDYGIANATQTVTIATTGSTTLTLATDNDGADEPDGSVSATVDAGTGYTVGTPSTGTVTVRDDDVPEITIAAGADVTEGGEATFTLSADPVPASPLAVKVAVAAAGAYGVTAGERAVTMPVSGTATLTVATTGDDADEPDGSVTATLKAGAGYAVGSGSTGTVAVLDDDEAKTPVATGPTVSIDDATAQEGTVMTFTVRLSEPSRQTVSLFLEAWESDPVSARAYADFWKESPAYWMTIFPGETEATWGVRIMDDSHDDGGETFEVRMSGVRGATVADGVAVGTIENDDPLPAAFLARFGRTVAEQALDGITGRMVASRTPGMQSTLAGQPLSPLTGSGQAFDPAASGQAASDGAALAMADIAQGLGSGATASASPGSEADPFGGQLGTPSLQSYSLTARQALLGSRFSLTGEADSDGGSFAFWGRAMQGRFDGVERGDETDLRLDGEVTTALLGGDYARGRWLAGVALLHSLGEGGYMGEGVDEVSGDVESRLTAAVPYVSLQASQRLRLWAALGYGTGDVTLDTGMGERLEAGTDWQMAALGMRGDVFAPGGSGGPGLALTSDALWTRTQSDEVQGLASSSGAVTRLRLGLEGSWAVSLSGLGTLTPKLEAGLRHDGGDVETGFGVELGGGIAWLSPVHGLSLLLEGRTLVAHETDLEDSGVSVALSFDPAPTSARGPSASIRQTAGGRAGGGVAALFGPQALVRRTGTGEMGGLLTAEAAWGFAAFGGRFTGSPHVSYALSDMGRDYTLGWRLSLPKPEPRASAVSFGVSASQREYDGAETEHVVGLEVTAGW